MSPTKRQKKLQRTKAQTKKQEMNKSNVNIVKGKSLDKKGAKDLTPDISKQIVDDLNLSGRGLVNDGVVETTVPKAKELPQDDVGHDMDIDDLSNICDEIIEKSKVAVKSFKEGNKDTLVNKVIKATKSEIVNPLVVTVLLNNKLQDTTQEDITNG